jgi:hypothetical protein
MGEGFRKKEIHHFRDNASHPTTAVCRRLKILAEDSDEAFSPPLSDSEIDGKIIPHAEVINGFSQPCG